jgi:cobalamin synthase
MLVLGFILALVTFLQEHVGISVAAGGAVSALAIIATYLFGEFKSDIQRVRGGLFQDKKWKDPAFWGALVAAILPVVSENLGIQLPIELITGVVAVILGLVFKKRVNDAKLRAKNRR